MNYSKKKPAKKGGKKMSGANVKLGKYCSGK